jgi:hypothetical protein
VRIGLVCTLLYTGVNITLETSTVILMLLVSVTK